MWFCFPTGTENITVQQQAFVPEVTEDDRKFFRAPDHFAPLILDLPGFSATRPQGKDIPADLPPTLPGGATASDALVNQISTLKQQLIEKHAAFEELTAERDKAADALEEALLKIEELENKLAAAAPKKA